MSCAGVEDMIVTWGVDVRAKTRQKGCSVASLIVRVVNSGGLCELVLGKEFVGLWFCNLEMPLMEYLPFC